MSVNFVLTCRQTKQFYRMANEARPKEWNVWQTNGRELEVTPVIENVASFGERFRFYWMSMQPMFRRRSDGLDWPPHSPDTYDDIAFDDLRKFGKSGFLLVMMMLVWWGASVDSARERNEWLAAVEDAIWVLREMVRTADAARGDTAAAGIKRGRGASEGPRKR